MSKLCDMLEARQTGRVQIAPETGLIRTEEYQGLFDGIIDPPMLEYRIGVVAQMRMLCKNDQELAYAKNNVKRQLIHEFFGEFRQPIILIERAIMQHKYEEAKLLLRELHIQMFSL